MSGSDSITYLNSGAAASMSGSLVRALESLPAKMQKAPAKEWGNALKSLVSKGLVKQAEIDDSELLVWLNAQAGSVKREEMMVAAARRNVTIKEVAIGRPMYEHASHSRLVPGARYKELLFIANSELANTEDRIEEIDWELEQFNFDLERLSEDPEAIFRLTAERSELMRMAPKQHDFTWSHFVRDDLGRYGKNLIAHARELSFGNTFLVEEIQSDWGQRGRLNEWVNVPKGPFVTETKLWAGLAMRRMMQRAAQNPQVEKFYWIRGSMSNGGEYGRPSSMDDFYLKTMAGIVDRVISPAGQKCRLETLTMGSTSIEGVPCFDMTPEVRSRLRETLPLYSLSRLLPKPAPVDSERAAALMQSARFLIGSAAGVRLVGHLYDISKGKEVAGSYINGLVQASLRAENISGVLKHECFHFGMDKLFSMEERRTVLRSFAPGTELNARIKDALLRNNEREAAAQCSDAEEAAANAFSYWSEGRMAIEETPVRGIFEELRVLVADTIAWVKKTVFQEKTSTVQELFKSFASGEFASAGRPGDIKPAFRGPEVDHSQDRPSMRV